MYDTTHGPKEKIRKGGYDEFRALAHQNTNKTAVII
jgi:hypothetical protein